MNAEYLVCNPKGWDDEERPFAVVKRQCCRCASDVVVQAENAPVWEAKGGKFLCVFCFALDPRSRNPKNFVGAMVHGEPVSISEGRRVVQALYRRDKRN